MTREYQWVGLIWAALLSVMPLSKAESYDLETHRKITETAFEQSILNKGYLEQGLSLSTTGWLRGADGQLFQPSEWLQEGSVREDDANVFSLQPFRFENHFYDPVNDRGLTHPLVLGSRAFEWALEEPVEITGQDFSWRDARRHFLTGLTASGPDDRGDAMAMTFRTLGQVMHVAQDMGSPEHTRNDPHAGMCLPTFFPDVIRCPFGAPSLFEGLVNTNGHTFSGYPSPLLNRLRDFWTTGDGRGFAEFTNRNFISKSTNFTSTIEGSTGEGYPSPQLRLGLRQDVDIQELMPGTSLTGLVTFFGNDVDDCVTGQVIRNPRMTTYSLFDSALRNTSQQEIFTINRFTIEEAGKILIPRAVGYSAGLLDYFFRGNLDVDLVEDPDNPSIVQLTGTNASPEKLDGGVLTVYADDVDGNRVQATPGLAVSADPGQNVASASFVAPENTERYVAVYQGKLGSEEPQANFPGAVIGKVLGGVRVEEVYDDFDLGPILRTPKGIYRLPIPPHVYDLRWGGRDNTIIGRNGDIYDQSLKFLIYEIHRADGSTDVPLRTESDGTEVVDLKEAREVPFPFNRDIGMVELKNTIHFTWKLPWAIGTEVFKWVEGVPSRYELQETLWEGEVTPAAGETRSPVVNFSIRLSPDTEISNAYGEPRPPYLWSMKDFAATQDGKVLVEIEVFPNGPVGEFPLFFPTYDIRINPDSPELVPGTPGEQMPRPVQVGFMRAVVDYPLMYTLQVALVDAENGQVMASTAPENISLARQVSMEGGSSRIFMRGRYVGGNDDGKFIYLSQLDPIPVQCDSTQVAPLLIESTSRDSDEVSGNQYRNEIDRLIPKPKRVEIPSSSEVGVNCDTARFRNSGVVVRTENTAGIAQVIRPRWGAGETLGVMVQGLEPLATGDQPSETRLVAWNPQRQTAEIKHQFPQGSYFISDATSKLAMVRSYDWVAGKVETSLIPLQSDSPPAVDPELQGLFTLLEPDFLYNTMDTKFYTRQQKPKRTPLPAPLAPASFFAAFGEFHALRLK